MRKTCSRIVLLVLAIAAGAQAVADTRVSARLIADHAAIAPGTPFRVGVLFTIPENAHIYWMNPGESGLPTEIRWQAPEGFALGPTEWPVPEAFSDAVLRETTFGYEKEALLFARVTPPAGLTPGATVVLRAQVNWLVCLESSECIPEEASLELQLATAKEAAPSSHVARFEAHAARVPRPLADAAALVKIEMTSDKSPELKIAAVAPWKLVPDPNHFFPSEGVLWLSELVPPDLLREDLRFRPYPTTEAAVPGALDLTLQHTQSGETRRVYLWIDPAGETKP